MLGRRIAARQPPPTCLPELRRALLDEWCNIPQDQIDNLILSMHRRFLIRLRISWLSLDDRYIAACGFNCIPEFIKYDAWQIMTLRSLSKAGSDILNETFDRASQMLNLRIVLIRATGGKSCINEAQNRTSNIPPCFVLLNSNATYTSKIANAKLNRSVI
ncbi:transposable element Tcb1 transposase [Trichonephila clavipes]|nr:transposable element Tcb1 transposase [Trichonephila clavipes]